RAQRLPIRLYLFARAGRNDPPIFRESSIDQLRSEANVADLSTNVVGSDGQLDGSIRSEDPLQLQNALARHDDLLLPAVGILQQHLADRQAMPIGRDRSQRLPIRFEEQPVQVVANVLLRHREMRLVDEPAELALLETQRLLRIDLLDDREIG